jgi:tetratricopeptide (TPR) repeat protein
MAMMQELWQAPPTKKMMHHAHGEVAAAAVLMDGDHLVSANMSPGLGGGERDHLEAVVPCEAELVLLCLDYLRDLRRAYEPQDLLEAEGLHADYLSVAIYSLSRSFVSPSSLTHENGTDAWMEPSSSAAAPLPPVSSTSSSQPSALLEVFEDLSHFPSVKEITKEIVYSKSPHEDEGEDEKQQDHCYDWYEYDDSHPSNAHRLYVLNGLASGPSLRGPVALGEVAAAGLASLQARTRKQAEKEMITSPLFEQFVQAVKSKGFFKDAENDVPKADPAEEADRLVRQQLVYEERFTKVVSKFRTKLASKAQAGELQGGGNPNSSALVKSAAEWQHLRRIRRMEMVLEHREEKKEDDVQQQQQQRRPIVSNLTKRLAPSGRKNSESPTPATPSQTQIQTQDNPSDLEEGERLKSLGNAHMQKKEYQDAAASYTEALKLSPSGPNSHVYYSNRAAALLSMKKFNDAILDSERSLSLKPNYGKAHARLGLAHFLLGNYRQAMEAYTVALKYEPDNKSSKSYLEKAAKRLAVGGESIDQSPGLIQSSFSVVSEWDKSERGRKGAGSVATQDSSATEKMEAREAERHKVRGNAHMANREYQLALEAYSAALKLSSSGPQSHVYYSNRAATLCYLERYQEAEKDSEKSLSLKPAYGKAHARLGLSRFFLNDFEGAVRAYTAALEFDPDNAASRSYMAKAKLKLERQNMGGEERNIGENVRRLLENPEMHKLARKALSNPTAELMEDPEMQRIAKKAMSDPSMMEAVLSVNPKE